MRPGDTLGLVGNTGNAKTTPPHLHFGVYRNGALDPLPFVRAADVLPAPPRKLPTELGQYVRARETRLVLRRTPATKSATAATAERPTPLLVLGAAAGWLRVQLPGGRSGFVPATAVRPAAALRREKLAVEAELQSFPLPGAPAVAALPAQTAVAVLGEFGAYRLVRQANGRTGWVLVKPV